MPHQCVRCSTVYPDASKELLKGCDCGGKFFFYIKKEVLEKGKSVSVNLTSEEKTQIEQDVIDIIGDNIDRTKPIVLDLESVRILKPGTYEIDIVELFKSKPLVYRIEEGKYIIDIARNFLKDED